MNTTESISDQVSAAILRALALAVASQELPSGLVLPDHITLERPKNRDHGDYATSIALALAKPAEMNPRNIAELIRTYLLADTDMKIIKDYDVWGTKKFMGKIYDGIIRTTFIIDEKGIIKHVITAVKTKEPAEQLKSLK